MGAVTLGSDLGIEGCTALRQTLAGHLDAASLEVDGAAAGRIHAASLQLLAAWWRDRDAAGHDTRWAACSESLQAAARTLGLDAVLGLAAAPVPPQPAEEEPA